MCRHKAWHDGYPAAAAANKQQTMKRCFQTWDLWLCLSALRWLEALTLDSIWLPRVTGTPVTDPLQSLVSLLLKMGVGWGWGHLHFPGLRERREGKLSSVSSYRALTLSGQDPILMASFNLNYPPKGPMSTYSHVVGEGLQHMNLRGQKTFRVLSNLK